MKKFELLRQLRNIEYKRNKKRMTITFKIYATDALEVFSGELDIMDARKMAATLTDMCDKLQTKHERMIEKAAKKAAKEAGIVCPMSEREDVVLTGQDAQNIINGPLVSADIPSGEVTIHPNPLGWGVVENEEEPSE